MTKIWIVGAIFGFGVLLGTTGLSRAATLDACGDIFVSSNFQCKVEPPGVSCDAKCQPLNMETSCRAQLFNECSPQCTFQVTEQEVQVCADTCVTDCNLSPGSFDCTGTCGAKCSADCSGKCQADANQAQCVASCKASCSGYCDLDCQAVLPELSCQEKCKKTCHGAVVAKVNMDCQLKCQTVTRYTDCTTKLTGGCHVQCQSTDGALFCNDQFVNFTSSLQQCIDALKNLNVSVDVSFKFSASGCAAGGSSPHAGSLLLLLGFVPLVFRRRSR